RRRALRHEGPVRLRRRQRRRRRYRGRDGAGRRAQSRAAPEGRARGAVRPLRRRGGDGRLAAVRGDGHPGLEGLRQAPRPRAQVADPARLRRRGVRVPGGRGPGDHGRPRAVPRARGARHRPHPVALRLLAPALRRPHAGGGALARPHGGDGVRADSYTQEEVTVSPEKLLLAAPRGYCAGVDRAVQTVERALELHGAPVYVRKEIVHNKHVVAQLRERGAVFVDQETEVPEGETVVFSAHGVSPAVHANAETRRLTTIDATCPLVTKVHVEAKKFAAQGYTIVLIGHQGHEEVEGTM